MQAFINTRSVAPHRTGFYKEKDHLCAIESPMKNQRSHIKNRYQLLFTNSFIFICRALMIFIFLKKTSEIGETARQDNALTMKLTNPNLLN